MPTENRIIQKRELKLTTVPENLRDQYKQAWGGSSRTLAVKLFCQECLGFDAAMVKTCTCPECSLYEYRL